MSTRFTEEDLREVLAERSTGGTPPPDLAGNAERAGRRHLRRRAATTGGVLAASALAVGGAVAALPSAGAAGTHTAHGTHTADGIAPADGGDPVTLVPERGRIAGVQYTYAEATHARLNYTPHADQVRILIRCTGDGLRVAVSVTGKAATTDCARYVDGNWPRAVFVTGITPDAAGTIDVTIVRTIKGRATKGSWAVGVYEQ